ncbi:glycine zipper 2TM domain-containing protein [Sphingomonas sp. AP4-R1]|uniref:glycine zipper 2TM domain-containing protein n=1 Tax=Sphingomonas sp. AP4-R1 TaxID=2735134 RepID=UPI0014934AD6|nr:glycine zipper 2TM domain-containing protein [Sphingomonas sp. AP4-R1]QJU56795.1 glycine zipper 2TM domain-containing protein [Sphingomonas sp. AP4-R1]
MFKQIGFAAAMLAASVSVPGAADAQRWQGERGYYQQIDQRDYDRRGYDRGGYDRGYDDRGYGRGPGPGYDRRGYRGRGRCDKGTGGTIIGAIAGGLLGNSVAGRGDRGVGTIVGAGVGALAGRAIDRDC